MGARLFDAVVTDPPYGKREWLGRCGWLRMYMRACACVPCTCVRVRVCHVRVWVGVCAYTPGCLRVCIRACACLCTTSVQDSARTHAYTALNTRTRTYTGGARETDTHNDIYGPTSALTSSLEPRTQPHFAPDSNLGTLTTMQERIDVLLSMAAARCVCVSSCVCVFMCVSCLA